MTGKGEDEIYFAKIRKIKTKSHSKLVQVVSHLACIYCPTSILG